MRPAVERLLLIALGAGILAVRPVTPLGWLADASGRQTIPQRPPVFRSGVNLVEVDAVATDAGGRSVTDLAKDEFQVLEDGKPKTIVSFAVVDLPIAAPRVPPASDVSTNERADQGRLYFLLLDDIFTLRTHSENVKALARHLVERLAPEDRVAAMALSTEKKGAREFTADHRSVLQAIDRFSAEALTRRRFGPSPLPAGAESHEDDLLGDRRRLDEMDIKRFFDTTRMFGVLRDVSALLAAVPHRRKALIYIGQGPIGSLLKDVTNRSTGTETMSTGFSSGDYVQLDAVRAITAAQHSNVAFYSINPNAPSRFGEEGFEEGGGPLTLRDLARQRREAIEFLSTATGGFAVEGSGTGAVDRVLRDTSRYYLLGYYADPPVRGNRAVSFLKVLKGDPWSGFRSIEVRTTRPGVRIRARKGYWFDDVTPPPAGAPATTAREATSRVVAGLIPQSRLRLRAWAAPFKSTPGRSAVALAVEVSAPDFVGEDGALSDEVEMVALAVEAGAGVRRTERASVRLSASRDTLRGRPVRRYVVGWRLDVTPGDYQIRVGVRSKRAAAAGSVYCEVSVPDFAKAALGMSGLAFGQLRSADPAPAAGMKSLVSLLPFTPTLAREFLPDDAPWVYLRLYKGRNAPASKTVTVRTVIASPEDGVEHWSQVEEMPRASFDASGAADYKVVLPLDSLGPGSYRLRVAAGWQDQAPAGVREVDFKVLNPLR
jgi:VWFA-related protein